MTVDSQEFMAMDSSKDHKFNFNPAISFLVNCSDQKETDYFWKNYLRVVKKFNADG